MSTYLGVLKNYADFTGRARRKEYWIFLLISTLVVFCLIVIEGLLGFGLENDESLLATIYELAVLVPTVAVGVRRMHDTNHSGWWLLFPIVNLFLAIRNGEQGPNRFGPDPKAMPDMGAGTAAAIG